MGVNIFGDWAQGASHNRAGIEWQDHWRKIDYVKGVHILSVADGHGSEKCPYSAEGARLATRVFCSLMLEYYNSYDDLNALQTFLNREGDTKFARTIDLTWKEEVLSAQEREGRNIELSEKEICMLYGTTVLGLMITGSFVFSFQIGDGKCVALREDDSPYEPIPWDDRCFLNKTTSICDTDALSRFRCCYGGIESAPAAIFLGSDGIDDSFGEEENLYNFYVQLAKGFSQDGHETTVKDLELSLPVLSKRGSQDDMSVAGIYDDRIQSLLPQLIRC